MTLYPDRGRGVTIGALAAIWPLALGVGVLARASSGDATLGTFVLYLVAGLLLIIGLTFGYWTYACASMRYVLDDAALHIHWGAHRVSLPLRSIDVAATAPSPTKVSGLNWPGHHVGKAVLEGGATVAVFATEFSHREAVYIRADDLIFALTPAEPSRMVVEVEARRRTARPFVAPARPSVFEPRAFIADRTVGPLVGLALALNVATFGVLFARYEDLPSTLAVDYPVGADTANIIERGDLFAIPVTGLALILLNVALGIALHRRQHALMRTILGGTIFLQGVLVVSAAAASA